MISLSKQTNKQTDKQVYTCTCSLTSVKLAQAHHNKIANSPRTAACISTQIHAERVGVG